MKKTILGWIPFAALFVGTAFVWVRFLQGGAHAISSFLLLLSVIPIIAVLIWIPTFLRTAWKKHKLVRFLATHALTIFCLWPFGWNFMLFPITFPYSIEKVRPTASIRVPTDRAMTVAHGGDTVEHNYHAMLPDQRWAYDLTIPPFFTGSPKLEDYGCYGVPIVAPVSGRVHVAHDGEKDQVPGKVSWELKHPLGNNVVIELDTGGYLLIAHMKTGSVLAKEGERITEGTPIGQCGNSGNTSEPHVHVHAQRQDPKKVPINMAEGLPLFFHSNEGGSMPLGQKAKTVIRHNASVAAAVH